MPLRTLLRLLDRYQSSGTFGRPSSLASGASVAPLSEAAVTQAAERGAALAVEQVDAMLRRTRADQTPQPERLTEAWRDLEHVRLNSKVLGSFMARELYLAAGLDRRDFPPHPVHVGLTSKLCVQADIEADWTRYWCGQLRMAPAYHRKLWEDCFVMQALWEAGMLTSGRRGLGFAVGIERLPCYLAGQGVQVLATDLSGEDQRAAGWRRTDQHAESLRQLHDADLCAWDTFERLCSFRPVDMTAIPEDLDGSFDFCWSVCSFEHLGSIETGLAFVANSLRCLRPGGIAVHTTEYNLSTGDETIDFSSTVLFQQRHLNDLRQRLAIEGHELLALDLDPGSNPLDSFVDVPPFPGDPKPSSLRLPDAPHLRLSTDGFPVTSVGLIVRRA